MADYTELKAAIRAAIFDNTEQAITGESLQEILVQMVDELGESYVLPEGGIPASDLAQAVRDALAEAVSAYQLPVGGIPEADLAQAVRNALAAGLSAYQKPQSGIPSADLAQAVRDALAAALSAYQKPSAGIPKTDLSQGVQNSLNKADEALTQNDIADNLTTDDATKVLSAKQGVVLAGQVSQLGQEVTDLEAKVTDLEGVLDIETIPDVSDHTIENNDFTNEDYYVKTDGTLASATSWKTTPFIPIAPGTPITAKLTSGSGAAVMAFYSADNEASFVSYWNGNTGNEVSSTVPQNASYFRACTGKGNIILADAFVNFKQGSTSAESLRIRDIEEDIQGLEENAQTLDERIQGIEDVLDYGPGKGSVETAIGDGDFTVDGNYIKTDGTLVSNRSWKTTPFIIVKPGTTIDSKLTNGSGNTGIAFYSSDNEESFISMWNGNTGSEVSGTVPDGANYFRACTGKFPLAIDNPFVKYKEPSIGSGVIEEIKDDISSMQEEMDAHFLPFNTGKSWCSIGDSITWLNDNIGGRPLTKGYQDVVREKLTFTHFYNRGLSGYTAIGYSADSILNNLEVADIYTIFLGINDWGNTNLSQVGTMDDYKNFTSGAATNYAQAMKKIVKKCKTLNANSVILLFTPRRGKNSNGFLPSSSLSPNDAGIYLHEFADIIRQVSEYEGMALIDLYYHSGVNDANLSAFSYDDALHPNDAGMRIIGQMLYDKMKYFVL